jgi:alkylation response protein AidB-like acyl-CoA dehydrogenase
MNNLVLEQYTRLLDKLPPSEPWAALQESGFLNLLRPEEDGGADLSLNDLFPLALETGARSHAPVILETMVARLMNPDAIAIGDVERALSGHRAARPLAAAVAAGQMVGAFEEVLRMTVEYATTRRQFGREIGHFQAIKHHVAIMAEEVAYGGRGRCVANGGGGGV